MDKNDQVRSPVDTVLTETLVQADTKIITVEDT